MDTAVTDFAPIQLPIPQATWSALTRAQKDQINCCNNRCFPYSFWTEKLECHRPVLYPNGDYYYEGEKDVVNKVIAQLSQVS